MQGILFDQDTNFKPNILLIINEIFYLMSYRLLWLLCLFLTFNGKIGTIEEYRRFYLMDCLKTYI